LRSFAMAWENHRNSPEAEQATHTSGQSNPLSRLSKQIFVLQQRLEKGRGIAKRIDEDNSCWYNLSSSDKTIWHEYTFEHIQRQISELRVQQQPRTPGAAEMITTSMQTYADISVLHGLT
jgi:hypothetical protein